MNCFLGIQKYSTLNGERPTKKSGKQLIKEESSLNRLKELSLFFNSYKTNINTVPFFMNFINNGLIK